MKTSLMPLAILLVAAWTLPGCQRAVEHRHSPPRAIPAVASVELVGTVIVPTLDTPLVKPGNAVWCATFQVAWNEMRDNVIGSPLRIANAQAVVDRLNDSPVSESALPPGSYFAAAGRLDDGIVEKIQQAMARRFPDAQLPDFAGAAGFVTYGYLNKQAVFTTPFLDKEH